MYINKILTMHNEHDPFADRGRHTVRGDAKVRSHVKPVDPGYAEDWAFHTH